ncbi:GNAT family N-acetyltransferase [Williamsia sp.]|uniref:GNAT family N-acetyltransferase n=1 Tax=Williamsia sp. TaxID=1872085 RepID=UPI002F956AFC
MTAAPARLPDEHVLDDPIGASLKGFHAGYAQVRGRVRRFEPDVSKFMSIPADPTDDDWASAASLAVSSGVILFSADRYVVPEYWPAVSTLELIQMIADNVDVSADPDVVVLGEADVPEMMELTSATKPGPFEPRTIELGTYVGIRDRGHLVAMAGERMRVAGWTEISAICTARSHRGQGLAVRLIHTLVGQIQARGEQAFLHAAITNTSAIDLYERLGFRERRRLVATGLSAI